jgi:uncharacterized membrane protein
MNPDDSDSLIEEVVVLRQRVRRIEEALLSQGIHLQELPIAEQAATPPPPAVPSRPAPVPQQGIPQSSAPEGFVPPPVPAWPDSPALFAQHHAAAVEDTRSLESRIGSQWFNRVGILAVLIGMAWFLKLAIDNHWIGPLGRVLIGLIAGAALIAWSERFRSRGYTAFSYSLKAVGSGVLYLSLWAAFSLYHLMPSGAAFAAMIVITAFNGFMSWVQESELLALYAIAGGLSTPMLLSTGENHQVALFSYLLLLDLAVLILVALRPWSRLLFAAFVGTVFFYFGWYLEFYTELQSLRTSLFLSLFFLIFAFAPRLVHLKIPIEPSAESQLSAWDNLAIVLLPVANAAFGFFCFYIILDRPKVDWAEPWLAVAFAAFYLLLLRLPARGSLQSSPALLSGLHLSVAVVFLTIAIPLKAHGRWITIGWLIEGAALLWVANRNSSRLLRVLAVLCLVLGLGALVTINPAASLTPIFNQRFGTYCVAIAACAFVAWLAAHATADAVSDQLPWPALAATAALAVNALILIAVSLEIHSFWWYLRWQNDFSVYSDYRMHAQFTDSAWFMLYGAILLAAGFWRRSSFLRWQALVLLAFAIGKVFLVDVSQLSQGYRILSFLGLGALLLAVSFVYQRDWLNLRGREHHGTPDSNLAGRSS